MILRLNQQEFHFQALLCINPKQKGYIGVEMYYGIVQYLMNQRLPTNAISTEKYYLVYAEKCQPTIKAT